uniref:Plastid light harvesting protein n=2 Tax=Pseudo-nitzschia australis TaxID=44445 RepID=A0A7S4A9S4_9STRA|mmetsp:Transcript_806/g.1851  ORF Transcript_806/g.1851 Transcript_806/m.1851 type:complete len:193 (+) Transcript_806:102-680(+)|eukprot:CAMPEP_0168179768 /NCGR_PEP_ID=MMETSP0139_2-20121125/10054_1 /TAXON_ID=44445 /ORGANISM="Pseudo-nitzschia australis, Strain 10249 10 AB" /LENGTH=192 /DNA_ID=CAMNT_0008099689 /DNA_START=317 /DNA_END=895 /DNA_ORIENTATION=+
MKLAILLSAIAGASAFAPASQQATSKTQLNAADLETLRGVGPETGGKIFDPWELSQWAPIDHLRKAELANGRSAMLATVGWSFPKLWTFEGPVTTTDPVEAFWAADNQWWAQFVIFCAVIEGIKYRGEMEGKSFTGEIDKEACLDWTGNWAKMNDTQKEDMAMKELKNGRLAMIGMAGYFASIIIPGSVPAL